MQPLGAIRKHLKFPNQSKPWMAFYIVVGKRAEFART